MFLRPDGTLPRSLMPDFCHPSEAGYTIWADALRPLLAQAVPISRGGCAEIGPGLGRLLELTHCAATAGTVGPYGRPAVRSRSRRVSFQADSPVRSRIVTANWSC